MIMKTKENINTQEVAEVKFEICLEYEISKEKKNYAYLVDPCYMYRHIAEDRREWEIFCRTSDLHYGIHTERRDGLKFLYWQAGDDGRWIDSGLMSIVLNPGDPFRMETAKGLFRTIELMGAELVIKENDKKATYGFQAYTEGHKIYNGNEQHLYL